MINNVIGSAPVTHGMTINNVNVKGLTTGQVVESGKKYGYNRLQAKKENRFYDAIKSLAKEPMVILLLVASAIYFISGNTSDGVFLSVSIVLVSAISLYQDNRSRNALAKLKDFTRPNCKVIRNGVAGTIKTEELVIGDCLVIEEGESIAADGVIVHSNDFSVDESILTGESMPVFKDQTKPDKLVYQGTTVASGLAIAAITAIGANTSLGKIGKSLENISEEKTPLELQINNFVKKMVIAGAIVFIIVCVLNYFNTRNPIDSLLKSLTLAMSILPEEIPVAFTTFMALGAWRLMKMGIVVKQMKTVETLGSATVICTDKTGTITENKMTLAKLFALSANKITNVGDTLNHREKELITLAMWASEPIPFDPMEKALHEAYTRETQSDERPQYKMVHEYPLAGIPPMMTHLFENASGSRIIAAKGAPEALMTVSNLLPSEKSRISEIVKNLAEEGYRILAVGEAAFNGDDFPAKQQQFQFTFKGIVAFYDPPKKNIHTVLQNFYTAGIDVKIVTGDYAATTIAIAKKIGFTGYENSLTGEDVMNLGEKELIEKVKDTFIYIRMYPDAKLRIINALKTRKEIVAMIGDGVNDGPALKAAHIGIAMGKKGTEIAKQAASLVLLTDDISKMVDAIAMGRRIYTNLKKAIQYIISIHIPIILTVFVPLAMGWIYPNIFSPVHIIFFELIMGPTCSIIYENEPIENNLMNSAPRQYTRAFFKWDELVTSIIQGLAITAGTLAVYQYAVHQGLGEPVTRTMVFVVLISANIVLTLVNRSFYYSIITTLKSKNNLIFLIIAVTIAISCSLLAIAPLTRFFGFTLVSVFQILLSIVAGFVSVIWYEVVKSIKRVKVQISSRPLSLLL